MLKMVQFSLFKLPFKCENIVSFRGASPLTPWPGALPLVPTGGIATALAIPHQKILDPRLGTTMGNKNHKGSRRPVFTGPSTNRGRRALTSVNVHATELALVATANHPDSLYMDPLLTASPGGRWSSIPNRKSWIRHWLICECLEWRLLFVFINWASLLIGTFLGKSRDVDYLAETNHQKWNRD